MLKRAVGWCDDGSSAYIEWPRKGGRKSQFAKVMADGSSNRYQLSMYAVHNNERMIYFINLGGIAEVVKAFVPFNGDKSLF